MYIYILYIYIYIYIYMYIYMYIYISAQNDFSRLSDKAIWFKIIKYY